jgi:sulfur relay (sulfurtransferase) DsrF/TusC family protein
MWVFPTVTKKKLGGKQAMIKKAMALVLSLALAASTFVAGAAFSDVPADHKNAKAINLMSEMGVLQGKEGDVYDPAGTLTRAEACAIIYRITTGTVDTPKAPSSDVEFPDVSAEHWAGKYIQHCVGLGVVDGYPDDTFKPDQAVTYAEFVTMMVRALGVDTKDFTFPNSYMSIAAAQGMTDGVTLNNDDPAARADVAEVTYNTIFEADYVRAGRLDNGQYPTISEDVFELQQGADRIVGADATVTVGSKSVKVDESLIGHNVQVYYNRDNKNEVVNIYVVDSKLNKVFTAKAEDIEKTGSSTITINGNTMNPGNTMLRMRNGNVVSTILDNVGKRELSTFEVISNDGNHNTYEAVKETVKTYGEVLVVADKEIVVEAVNGTKYTIDTTSKNVSVYDGIKKGDRVTFVNKNAGMPTTVTNATLTKVEAQTGAVSSVNGDETVYTIGGTQYTAWQQLTGASKTALEKGATVEFYAVDGYVVEANAVTSELKYAYVTDIKAADAENWHTTTVYMMTTEGETVSYPVANASTVTGALTDYENELVSYQINKAGEAVLTPVVDSASQPESYSASKKEITLADKSHQYINDESVVFMVNDGKVSVVKGQFPDVIGATPDYEAVLTTGAENAKYVKVAAIDNASFKVDTTVYSALLTEYNGYDVAEDAGVTTYTHKFTALVDGVETNLTYESSSKAQPYNKGILVDVTVATAAPTEVLTFNGDGVVADGGYKFVEAYEEGNKVLKFNGVDETVQLASDCKIVKAMYGDDHNDKNTTAAFEGATVVDEAALRAMVNAGDQYVTYVAVGKTNAAGQATVIYVTWFQAK